MRRLVRGKSETDMFFDKENLEIINDNLKKFRNVKVIRKIITNEPEKLSARGPKNSVKNFAKSALMNRK